MTMTLPLRHPSRPATQGNLSAVTVLNLLQKCVVHFCSEFNTVTGASAPPLLPSSSCSFVNRAHPSSKSWPRLCRAHRKHVAVRAWPRVNAFPDCSLAHFDVQAPLSQLRLHKSLRVVKELSTPDVGQVLYDHLKTGGFHHLRRAQQDIDTDSEPRQRRHSSLLSHPPRDRGRLAVTADTVSPLKTTWTLAHASTSSPPTTWANASTTNASPLPCSNLTTAMPTYAHVTETTTTAKALTTATPNYSLSKPKSC